MGIPHFKHYPIIEPSDSYYFPNTNELKYDAKKYYFDEIWAKKTIESLPAPFALVHFILTQKEMDREIANQPIEKLYTEKEDYESFLDRMDTKEWIYTLPCYLEKYYKYEAKHLLTKLEKEQGKFDCKTSEDEYDKRMEPVALLLQLYSRSALGLHPEKINAEAFVNFYWSEIQTRYTSTLGTMFAVNILAQRLKSRPNVHIKMNSLVTSIEPVKQAYDIYMNKVTYLSNNGHGQWIEHVVYANHVVYASHLGFAPEIIKGFKQRRPKQAKLMSDIEYVHYNVYVVTTKGHPWRQTYDLWLRDKNYKPDDPTDIILGRWQELDGYRKYKSFEHDPPGDGILTIYHPLPYDARNTSITDEQAVMWAKRAVKRAIEMLQP